MVEKESSAPEEGHMAEEHVGGKLLLQPSSENSLSHLSSLIPPHFPWLFLFLPPYA